MEAKKIQEHNFVVLITEKMFKQPNIWWWQNITL